MFGRILILFFTLLIANTCYGHIRPEVTWVKRWENGHWQVNYRINSLEGDSSPNPMRGRGNDARIGVGMMKQDKRLEENPDEQWDALDHRCIVDSATMRDLAACIRNFMGLPYENTHEFYHDDNFEGSCPVVFYKSAYTSADIPLPGSICEPFPVPNSCTIDGDPVIEHGTIRQDDVSGHRAEGQVRVSCPRPTDIRIVPLSTTVTLGRGLSSKLEINGKLADQNGVQIRINRGPQSVGITSVLQGERVAAGMYSGNILLVLSFF